MLDDVLNRFYGEYNEFDRLLAAIKAKLDEHYTKKIFHLSDKNSINGHDSLCCCDECIALIRAAINPEDEQTGEQQ